MSLFIIICRFLQKHNHELQFDRDLHKTLPKYQQREKIKGKIAVDAVSSASIVCLQAAFLIL